VLCFFTVAYNFKTPFLFVWDLVFFNSFMMLKFPPCRGGLNNILV